MAPKYQEYLAASILNEGIIVNYRMLSRALKIHVNAAKEMLYDFHRTQNARKPSSIHATYLLSGTRKPATSSQTNGNHTPAAGDNLMSDGIMSSSMPAQEDESEQIPVTTITLVAEEHLEAVKASYSSINSIHVYSIEPGPLTNIHILADCNRKVATEYASEDPLVDWKQYGTIQNPNAKRRTTRKPPPPAAPVLPTTAGMRSAQKPVATAQKAPPAAAAAPKPASAESSRPPSRQGPEAPKSDTKKPATLKKESSSLFKSFAKTIPPAAKKEASASEDDPMRDAPSEGEDETPAEETAETKALAEAARLKRQQSKADIDAMMDAPDDEKPGTPKEQDEDGDTAMSDADAAAAAEEAHALDAPAQPELSEQQTSTSGGRRRGRRKVMKKKTTRDKDNYLVTTEEAVWESFSEDEPEPKRKTVVAAPVGAKKSVGGGGGGGASKKGQGNIMNFFGKR